MPDSPTPPPLPTKPSSPASRVRRRQRRGLVPLLTLGAVVLLAGAIVLADWLHERRRYERAAVLLDHQEYGRAERIYRRRLADAPDDVDARAGLALALLGREAWAEAAEAFEAVLAEDPEYDGAHGGLSYCQHALGQDRLALENLERAITLDEARGESNAKSLLLFAMLLRDESRYIEAESALRRATEGDEATGPAHALLGRVLHDQGRTPEGLAVLDAALSRYPQEAMIHFQLGEVHRERGAAGTAAAAYRTARELGLSAFACDLGLAHALRDSGDVALALRVLEKLTRTHDREPAPWFSLGLMREGEGQTADARACYDRCLTLDRDHAGAQEGLLRLQRTADR